MFLLSLKFDIMREVVLGSDLHMRHAHQGSWIGYLFLAAEPNRHTIAVFRMASPVTIPAKPALLITCKDLRSVYRHQFEINSKRDSKVSCVSMHQFADYAEHVRPCVCLQTSTLSLIILQYLISSQYSKQASNMAIQ